MSEALFWIALLFLIAVLVAGPWLAIRRGLAMYRTTRDSLDRLTAALDEAVSKLDEASPHLDAATAAGERLSAALERLQRSRARLAVLTRAIAEVQASVNGVLRFVPR